MAEKYTVKSDYTLLRKKRQLTEKGDVYENNIMTITPLETLFTDGQEIIYSDSNFKFSTRTDIDTKKKYNKYPWLKTPEGDEHWTLSDIDSAPISDESKIRIKPNYNSLRDFAYYGSAVEMVHATVNNVLMYFPGEIYFSNDEFKMLNSNGEFVDSGYKIAYNDFQINVETNYVNEDEVINKNRYLAISSMNYNTVKDGEVIGGVKRSDFVPNPDYDCGNGFIGSTILTLGEKELVELQATSDLVQQDGELVLLQAESDLVQQNTNNRRLNLSGNGNLRAEDNALSVELFVYLQDGIKYYLYNDSRLLGVSIRPKDEFVNEYFETIDEFESILLNRDSKPLYTAIFETPYETDFGYNYTMEYYIWPSRNQWNPQVNTTEYNAYLTRLIDLAEYHDEYDSNNLWRMMTHESIKNLDWTFFRDNGYSVDDMSKIDASRIRAILQLYGRQYDGLKRYIDNIKYSNKITYDEKNNVPDYFLTDAVELDGFNVFLPNPTAKTDVRTDEPLYLGKIRGSSEVDENNGFMRNLKLNSRYINSLKGTRHGLEAMLGLLGIKKDEYRITEYIGVAKGNDVCPMDLEELINLPEEETDRYDCKYPSAIDVEMINIRKDGYPNDLNEDDYYLGIACKPITVLDENGNVEGRYVIPWYEKDKHYDSDLYFQMKGGWAKKNLIDVSELQIQGINVTPDYIPNGIVADETFYDESKSKIKFAENIDELINFLPSEVSEGDICYVSDISRIGLYMNDFDDIVDEIEIDGEINYSHYFILKNINKSTTITLDDDGGWKYIYLRDILYGTTPDSKKVLYQEVMKERTDGNNPHIAKVDYDSGEEYVKLFGDIFNYSIENDDLSTFTDLDIEQAISTYNFNIESGITDNRKTDYFKPKYVSDLSPLTARDLGNTKFYGCGVALPDVEDMIEPEQYGFCVDGEATTGGSVLYNPENDGDKGYFQVPASYSLVNLKNVTITFSNAPHVENGEEIAEEWQNYIRKVVVEYVKQMLPSTCIFEWGFCDDYDIVELEAESDLVQAKIVSFTAIGGLEQSEGVKIYNFTAQGGLKQRDTSVTIYNFTAQGGLKQERGIEPDPETIFVPADIVLDQMDKTVEPTDEEMVPAAIVIEQYIPENREVVPVTQYKFTAIGGLEQEEIIEPVVYEFTAEGGLGQTEEPAVIYEFTARGGLEQEEIIELEAESDLVQENSEE